MRKLLLPLLILILLAAVPSVVITQDASAESTTYVIYCPWAGACNRFPLTQGYHSGHPAYDWGMPTGTALKNPFPHRVQVVNTGWSSLGYGYHITMKDNDYQLMSLFGHLRSNKTYADGVRTGSWVDPGQSVAYSDNTGNSTGPHLHMEITRPPYRWYTDNINFWYYLAPIPVVPPQPNPTPTPRPGITPVPTQPPSSGSYRARVIQSCKVYSRPVKNNRYKIGKVVAGQVITVSPYDGQWVRYGSGYLRRVCIVRI